MVELLDKLVAAILGQNSGNLTPILLIIIGYLAWQNYTIKKDHKDELKEYRETVDKLQGTLNHKNGEEREMLLGIIEKYHESQIGIREAISDVKAVLTTISALSQRGG
jgi:uncharacterized protein YbgA (DUF1722 family)